MSTIFQLFRYIFVSCILLLNISNIQAQSQPEIRYIQHGPNLFEFWVVNLPVFPLNCPDHFFEGNYSYFWNFGDGSYSFADRPLHEFHNTGTFVVEARVYPIYTPDNPPAIELALPVTIQNATNKIYPRPTLSINHFEVNSSQVLVPDTKITLILSHNYLTKGNEINHVDVNFTYPTNQFTFVESDPPLPSGYPLTLFSGKTLLQWHSTTLQDSTKNIFVTLQAASPNLLPHNSNVPFIFQTNAYNSSIPPNTLVNDTLILRVGQSIDPNRKDVNFSHVSGQQQLKYRLHFQNLGDAFSYNIRIEDNIDEHLQFAPLTVTGVVVGVNTLPTTACRIVADPITDKVNFYLDNILLPGTNQPGYDPCAAESTMGYIEYQINTINFMAMNVPDAQIFGTYADIYFDNNGAIRTNSAHTQVDYYNAYCPVNRNISNVTHIDTLVLHGAQNNITTNNLLADVDCVTEFDAGNTITLNQQTLLQGNSLLRIDGCNSTVASFKQTNQRASHNWVEKVPVTKSDNILQSYPNPFDEGTTIVYELTMDSPVYLQIFNINGQLITTIQNGAWQKKGKYQVYFDSHHLANGIYLCKLRTKNRQRSIKLQVW